MRHAGPRFELRDAQAEDIDALARLWFDGWQDAHANILPAELAGHRTLASFHRRLAAAGSDLRIIGKRAEPLGFHLIKGDELYQFYVAASARGSGAAAHLMADALRCFRRAGKGSAWLACAIGNDRAARFYEKCGWHRAGVMTSDLKLDDDIYPLDVWRYERRLAASECEDIF